MNIEILQRRLRRLGWKVRELGTQADGRWALLVTSCGHTIHAIGVTRYDAWSAACSTSMKLTLSGVRPGPAFCTGSSPSSWPGGGCILLTRATMINESQMEQLIEEYEELRGRARVIFREWNELDRRMTEIERILPDDYPYAGEIYDDSSASG